MRTHSRDNSPTTAQTCESTDPWTLLVIKQWKWIGIKGARMITPSPRLPQHSLLQTPCPWLGMAQSDPSRALSIYQDWYWSVHWSTQRTHFQDGGMTQHMNVGHCGRHMSRHTRSCPQQHSNIKRREHKKTSMELQELQTHTSHRPPSRSPLQPCHWVWEDSAWLVTVWCQRQ